MWGWYAAWLGRSSMAISDPKVLRVHIFVDDPLYIAKGDEYTKTLALTRVLLWAVVAGFPLAWHKSDGGASVSWIGALITAERGKIVITIPEDKLKTTIGAVKRVNRQQILPLKLLRQVAGKVMFIANIIPIMKPFLGSLWKAISDIHRAYGAPTMGRTSSRKTSNGCLPSYNSGSEFFPVRSS